MGSVVDLKTGTVVNPSVLADAHAAVSTIAADLSVTHDAHDTQPDLFSGASVSVS
jgi:hypothetical protein